MYDMHGETVCYDTENNRLMLLDQTLLPNTTRVLALTKKEDMVYAIQTLQVRGAPAIGVAAAIGMAVLAAKSQETDVQKFLQERAADAVDLSRARPTAVNLSWAVAQMQACVAAHKDGSIAQIQKAMQEKALQVLNFHSRTFFLLL